MKIITVQDVASIIQTHGFDNFILDLIKYLKKDFSRWLEFDKSPRHAIHVDGGVIELMPVADNKYYTYKCVNGHPKNPFTGKQTIIATGQILRIDDGYPLMFSEMTVLTALRTAAATALATDLLSRKNSSILAVIGTGAQSEFEVKAHCLVRDIKTVKYYDIDPKAMQKFAHNMQNSNLELVACSNVKQALQNTDIVIVCTACKGHVNVLENKWITDGMHINGLGGDCPGKTELEKDILYRSKIVVEFTPQSLIEGEIQRLSREEADIMVYAELWELITGVKPGRVNGDEITVYDSVGFALEDYSVLRLVHHLAKKYELGKMMEFIPPIADPKDLISILN